MATAVVWKGSLSFGLVSIAVELYSAIKYHSFGFKLLHAKCNSPINYLRWCSRCKKEIEWDDVVKGLKLEDGTYFIITKEKLEQLKPEKTDFIDIVEFVDYKNLEPIYFDHHYYVVPVRQEKAFFLFCSALEGMDKIAIGQFVLRDKQYVCAVQPYKNGLLLTTLNYDYEIKEVKKLKELKVPKISKSELELAKDLIQKLSVKKFDMSKFKDKFAQDLIKRIKQAVKGKLPSIKKIKKIKNKKEISLVQVLRASLKETKNESKARA